MKLKTGLFIFFLFSLKTNYGFAGGFGIGPVGTPVIKEVESTQIDERKKDELQCPRANSPASFSAVLFDDPLVITVTAKLKNGKISEFGGVLNGKAYKVKTYVLGPALNFGGIFGNETQTFYEGTSNSPPDSALSAPISKPPPAGTRIGAIDTLTFQVFTETDTKKKNYGEIKAFQYRLGNFPNMYVDLLNSERSTPSSNSDEHQSRNNTAMTELFKKTLEKLARYSECCPNESITACDKKWLAIEKNKEDEAAAQADDPETRGPRPTSGLKATSPSSR